MCSGDYVSCAQSLSRAQSSSSSELPILRWAQYEQIASDCGVAPTELQTATRFLHDVTLLHTICGVHSMVTTPAAGGDLGSL
jgi:hypothetical protein